MSEIFRKLNLKAQKEILVLNPPKSFEPELALLGDVVIHRSYDALRQVCFSLAFVTKQAELDHFSEEISKRSLGDSIMWFAYPKASSKNYVCEFNRDTGWMVLGNLGFEGVRQVAIDADWSAIRFRRVEFIKALKRSKERRLTNDHT